MVIHPFVKCSWYAYLRSRRTLMEDLADGFNHIFSSLMESLQALLGHSP